MILLASGYSACDVKIEETDDRGLLDGGDFGKEGLDMTDPAASSSSASAVAGEAADDDVEDGHDAVEDGFEDVADAINDGHDAGADGLEDGLDLVGRKTLAGLRSRLRCSDANERQRIRRAVERAFW